MSYFPPYTKNKKEGELDLSNYATNSDLKTQQVQMHHNITIKKMI